MFNCLFYFFEAGTNIITMWAVVMAELVKQSLPTPEVCRSNLVIGKLLYETFVVCQLY